MSELPQINIGLFGYGTVGSRVHEIIEKNLSLIEKKLGFPVKIKKICDPKNKADKLFTTNKEDILNDPEISIVVELIGNSPAALEVMEKSLEAGKHVVTANKAILATHGEKLFSSAAKNNVDLCFEAAVAGAIPILRSIREGFIADTILSTHGIINGTSNFILTGMAEQKREFADVLSEAQKLGYAEANPSSDVEGIDSAHKLTILMALAYGQFIPLEKIYTEGITAISSFDMEMADRFGYAIKLLAISKKVGGEIEARVHPTMVPKNKMLAQVKGAFNAVMLTGEYFGESLFYGMGAGGHPTATAVIADIVEIARNINLHVPGVPPLGVPVGAIKQGTIKNIAEINSEYYLRFNVLDKPGVFARISQTLGQNNISISSVHQHGQEIDAEVPIVVMTHLAQEKNIVAALKEIDQMPFVIRKTQLIRVES